MAEPHVHAKSSVRQFGGKDEDYEPIHRFLDSSKVAIADGRHRALTHNTWFINVVLPAVFGDTIQNSDGILVSVKQIGEIHVLEDFGGRFVPSAQDYLQLMEYEPWMNNGFNVPSSFVKLESKVGPCERKVFDLSESDLHLKDDANTPQDMFGMGGLNGMRIISS